MTHLESLGIVEIGKLSLLLLRSLNPAPEDSICLAENFIWNGRRAEWQSGRVAKDGSKRVIW